ncbi:MAG: diadenylate cyclase CdaA [Syntrophales bacterium]|nr:diadenylate cyclase CdaA [Syntrophales bacterium]MDD5641549.1 diadenylate cyclase CdaA [Syntrophales bacterium]
MWPYFSQLRWQDFADIILVAIIIYQVLLFLKGTQAIQVLAGMFLLFLLYLGAKRLELFTLEWLLDGVVRSFLLIVIILFQADIRRVLSRMGRRALASADASEPMILEEICDAVETLASQRIGALIILERQIGLSDYLEGAVKLDAMVTKELLVSLFWPHTPTHDGAVIIQGDRIIAAGCLLPLSSSAELDPTLGTRHRAAVGLTEHSDALALVVSETYGQVSLARGGKILRNLSRLQLRQTLKDLVEPATGKRGTWIERLYRFFGA